MRILAIGSEKLVRAFAHAQSFGEVELEYYDLADEELTKNLSSVHSRSERIDLFELSLNRYDYVLALTEFDAMNLSIAARAKSCGKKSVALIEGLRGLKELEFIKENTQIDYILNSDFEVYKFLKSQILSDEIYSADSFGKGKVQIISHRVYDEFDNKCLKDIEELKTLIVIAVARGDEIFIPNGQSILKRSDVIYIMGLKNDVLKFKEMYFELGEKKLEKTVCAYGIHPLLLKLLSRLNISLKVIEPDKKLCRGLRDFLGDALVINSGYSEAAFSEDADISIFISDDDAQNISAGMIAKNKNQKVIAKSPVSSYGLLMDSLGFTPLNVEKILILRLLKIINRKEGISTNHLFGGVAHVYEYTLPDESGLIGKRIIELELPKGVIVGAIIRSDGTPIIPRGKSILERGDRLVIFCMDFALESVKASMGVNR